MLTMINNGVVSTDDGVDHGALDGGDDVVLIGAGRNAPKLSKSAKITLTGAVYVCYIFSGMGISLIGPSLLDLADQVSSNVDHLSSTALVTAAVFYTIFSLGSGIICRYVNRQWFLIACLLISAAGQVWTPLASSLLSLTFCLVIGQAVSGGIDVSVNAWILAIWRNGSTHLIQGLHFCWAFGSAMAPLVMAPFLSVRNETISDNKTISYIGDDIGQNIGNETESKIYVVYYTSAALYVGMASIFIVLYFTIPYDESNEKNDIEDSDQNNISRYIFSKSAIAAIIGIAIAIICFDAGAEVSTSSYIPAMIVTLGFTKTTGAYISSARGFMLMFARFLGSFVAIKVPIDIILMVAMSLLLVGDILLAFATLQQHILTTPLSTSVVETLLWIGFSLMGFGIGPIYPGTISYAEKYVKLSDFTCGLFVSIGSINIILNLVVVGKFLEQMPIILVYNLFFATIVMILLLISFMVVVKKCGQRSTSSTFSIVRDISE